MTAWQPVRHLTLKRPSKRQFQVLVLLFLLCVAAPLYMLFHRVYGQLGQEALYQYRLSAEHVMRLVEDELIFIAKYPQIARKLLTMTPLS